MINEDFSSRVLPFDKTAAEHFAELAAERERAGTPISFADAQIAAICLAADAQLATRNVRDFSGTGLTLIDPWSVPA